MAKFKIVDKRTGKTVGSTKAKGPYTRVITIPKGVDTSKPMAFKRKTQAQLNAPTPRLKTKGNKRGAFV